MWSQLIWMQLGLKFDAYYKPSTISIQPSGLWSCGISNSPAFLWLFSLFSPPPPPHHFLFLPLSQALKDLLFFVFLSTLFFFTRDLPSSSQFPWPLPIFLMEAKKFLTAALPILCFAIIVILFVCMHACVRERNPASLATWLESYTNWRWSETLHLPLQQLLPWWPMAVAQWQRPSSQPREHLGEPRALCFDTHIYHWICWSCTAALLPAQFCCWSVRAFNFYSRQLCSVKRLGRISSINVKKIVHFLPSSLSRLTAHLFPLHALAVFSAYLPLALRPAPAAVQLVLVLCQGQMLSRIDQKL